MPQLALAEAEKTQTLASGLANKWEKMQRSYMEFCWSYLPGFRLSKARAGELLDTAVDHALADPWFFQPHEKLVFGESAPDHDYIPRSDLQLLPQEPPGDQRFDVVSVWRENPPRAMDSVGVYVQRSFRGQSEWCRWNLYMHCSRSWGTWECETKSRHFDVFVRFGQQRRGAYTLFSSTDGRKTLALASELLDRGIPIRVSRYPVEEWHLVLRDSSRLDEARAVVAEGAVMANAESVADRWRDSVLGLGLADEDVCRQPVDGSGAASHSTRRD